MWKSKELFLSFFLSLHVAQAAAVRDVYLLKNTTVASDNFQPRSSASLISADRPFYSSSSGTPSYGGIASTAAGLNITLSSMPRYTMVSAMPTSSSGSTPLYANTSLSLPWPKNATTTLNQGPSTRSPFSKSGTAVTTSLPYRSLPSLASQLSDDVSSALNMLFPSSTTSSSSSSSSSSIISHLSTPSSTTTITIDTSTSSSTTMSSATSSTISSSTTSTTSSSSSSSSTTITSAQTPPTPTPASSTPTSTPTLLPTTANGRSSDPTLSRAQLAGTITSAIVGASVLLIGLFYLFQRHRRQKVQAQEARLEEEMMFHGGAGAGTGARQGDAGVGAAFGGAVVGAVGGKGKRRASGAKIGSLRRTAGTRTAGDAAGGSDREGVFPHSAWLYDPPVSPPAYPASATPSPLTPSPVAKPGRVARSLRMSGAGRLNTRLGRIHEEEGANPFADNLVSPMPMSGSSEYGERGFSRWQAIGMERAEIGRNGEVPRPRSGVHELEDTQISVPGSAL